MATHQRRPVNLSIRADLLEDAKRYGINASRAAESGLLEAVRRAQAEAWRRENADAVETYNRKVDEGAFDEFLRRF